MKKIVDFFKDKKILFSSLEPIGVSSLQSRKKLDIYLGVNLKGYYVALFFISKKSRVLLKEANEFVDLHERLERYKDTKIRYKYILIDAPLCSKAKAFLEEQGWRVWQLGYYAKGASDAFSRYWQ